MGGVTAGEEESGTEGGNRRKSSSASSTTASNFVSGPSAGPSRKIRAGSISSMDSSLLPPSSSKGKKSTTSKSKGKAKKGAGVGTGESAADESSGEDEEEDEEAKMERMLRSFEHLGTELPPRVYEGGVSPLMPEKKKGKIPGSAMDRVSSSFSSTRLFERVELFSSVQVR